MGSPWTEERRQQASVLMRQRWKDPAFVDVQMRRMVQNWSNPVYRKRQNRDIIAGRRPMPLSNPRGGPCRARSQVDGHRVECIRRDAGHQYHVGVVGILREWTLQVVGWGA